MEIKMKTNKKNQFSSIEILLMIMLFASTTLLIYHEPTSTNIEYKHTIESSLDSIYQRNTIRNMVINENLSEDVNTQDWTILENILDKKFLQYEFKISNTTTSKTIINKCPQTYHTKTITQKFISLKNNNKYDFRKINLEVCS
jgi:K+ transporter